MSPAQGFLVYPDPENRTHTNFVILQPHSPRWFFTNRTGLEVLEILAQGGSPSDAANYLSTRYRVDKLTAQQDARRIADQAVEFLSDRPLERKPILRKLFLQITNRCNLRCVHCYTDSSRAGPDLAFEILLDLFRQFREADGHAITISGGEPLCHPRIEEILRAACESARKVLLVTNGTLITPELASRLAPLKLRIQLSLDGPDAKTHDEVRGQGSFDQAIAGLKAWGEVSGLDQVTLCSTAVGKNLSRLTGMVRMAHELGVPKVRFLPIRLIGRANALADRPSVDDFLGLVESLLTLRQSAALNPRVTSYGVAGILLDVPDDCSDGHWCPIGRQLVIDAEGNAYPCALLFTPEFRLGNVREESLSALRDTPLAMECTQAVTARRLRIAECRLCTWRNLCQAGCMAQAWEQNGTIWSKDPFCEYRLRAYPRAFDTLLAHSSAKSNVW